MSRINGRLRRLDRIERAWRKQQQCRAWRPVCLVDDPDPARRAARVEAAQADGCFVIEVVRNAHAPP